MSTTARVLTFGVVSGLVWSGTPGYLLGAFGEIRATLAWLFAGILAGISISFALRPTLSRLGTWSCVVFGALSLPLGVFGFSVLCGILIEFVRPGSESSTNIGYTVAQGAYVGLGLGIDLAYEGLGTRYAFVLVPLAVFTALLLRAAIRYGGDDHAA